MAERATERPGTWTSPGGALPEGIEERSLKAGGVTFRVLQGGPAPAANGPTPVLLLHGYPTWAEVWLPIVPFLAGRSWMAVDLPCHNKSSALPGKDRSLTAYRRAIAALIDALDLPRVAIIGSSMGGSLGIMMALDRPDRIERLVLLDAAGLTAKIPGRAVRLYLPFLLSSLFRAPGPKSVRKLLRKGVFFDPRFADDAWVKTIVAAMGPRDRRKDYVATGFALRKRDASVAADLSRVRVPTLVIWGRNDPQFSWQEGEAATRSMPNATFNVLEESGHFPHVEKPRETGELVRGFLSDPGATR
jgi:2-hydroxy-6-oxo-6-(2'-carboxyphenyl)-hexa-2,4-dienoate hydrolase